MGAKKRKAVGMRFVNYSSKSGLFRIVTNGERFRVQFYTRFRGWRWLMKANISMFTLGYWESIAEFESYDHAEGETRRAFGDQIEIKREWRPA